MFIIPIFILLLSWGCLSKIKIDTFSMNAAISYLYLPRVRTMIFRTKEIKSQTTQYSDFHYQSTDFISKFLFWKISKLKNNWDIKVNEFLYTLSLNSPIVNILLFVFLCVYVSNTEVLKVNCRNYGTLLNTSGYILHIYIFFVFYFSLI